MHDPLEGVTSAGMIRTGASRHRIPEVFAPMLAAAVDAVEANDGSASLYVYGSVATGKAQVPTSDVDLLTVGLRAETGALISADLSAEFADLCRAVEIGAAQPEDFSSESDEGYGGRVFLRHYCVHLSGPDLHSALPEFPADDRAALLRYLESL